MQKIMNLKIKFRESFRPFAPMILEQHADKYFEMPVHTSPFMQFIAKCKQPDEFPAIVHYDNTSRVQTVDKDTGPVYDLLQRWYKETGCPMLSESKLARQLKNSSCSALANQMS